MDSKEGSDCACGIRGKGDCRMSYVEPFMREAMNELRLRKVRDRVFKLHKKGTWVYRTLITFNEEGIILQGDLSLGQDASGNVCSFPG